MSVIILEGPEKSGKSTLAVTLEKALSVAFDNVIIRHWEGRAIPDDSIYLKPLIRATSVSSSELIEIWDRGWPSEYVYGNLLSQPRRLANDPWLGEWLYGRAVQPDGLRVMLAGPSASRLQSLRDSSDLPVSPMAEKTMYIEYGMKYGWLMLEQTTVDEMANIVGREFLNASGTRPPMYCGKPDAEVVFVGERHSKEKRHIGAWLPFTSVLSATYGRLLGPKAFQVGWVIAHECPPNVIRSAKVIVACGKRAHLWVDNYIGGSDKQIYHLPHPSYNIDHQSNIIQTLNKIIKDI